jgi:H+/gluconate symporter-like permease
MPAMPNYRIDLHALATILVEIWPVLPLVVIAALVVLIAWAKVHPFLAFILVSAAAACAHPANASTHDTLANNALMDLMD